MNKLQEALLLRFYYDKSTGILYNNINKGKVKKGVEAGNLTCKFKYREVYFEGRQVLTHRIIGAYMFGAFPTLHIDHTNHNGLDNRLINLREVSHKDNLRNQKRNSRNTSGFAGVSWVSGRNKWRAYISINSKVKHLGYTGTAEEAYGLRKAAEQELGYHANHGKETI